MKQPIILLCVLVSCASAAPLSPATSPTNDRLSTVVTPSEHTDSAVEVISPPEEPSLTEDASKVSLEESPHQREPRAVGVPSAKPRVTFQDWFSQLSIWYQIPLAVIIFFTAMSLLIMLLNIIFFFCTFCCACGLACFVPNEYVRI